MQLLSQVTTRMRTYGADCNQTDFILDALKRTRVNVQVFLGIYMSGDPAVYARQRDTTLAAIKKFGTANIAGVTVGNEYMLDQTNNGTDVTTAETTLAANINDFRTQLATLSLDKTIPVGTAEVPSFISTTIVSAADYVMANAHPYFSGVSVAAAGAWSQTALQDAKPQLVTAAGKTLYMGEVGWPSDGSALSSTAAEQTFIDTFVCDANTKTVGYFFFELIDAYWKPDTAGAGEIEKHWGIFDKDKKLKMTVPTCLAAAASTPIQPPASTTGGGSTPGTTTSTGNGPAQTSNKPSSGSKAAPAVALTLSMMTVALMAL
jgi:exo-beta-1,3-glucanase (GH17 family)